LVSLLFVSCYLFVFDTVMGKSKLSFFFIENFLNFFLLYFSGGVTRNRRRND